MGSPALLGEGPELSLIRGASALPLRREVGVDEALALAEELTERTGIRVGIHNHGGLHWLGSRTALRWILSKTSDRIGLCLDTAWALDSGEDPIEMISEFGDRLHLLHIKDFAFGRDRLPEDVTVGTGNIDLKELDAAILNAGFDGEAILEYEGEVDDPVPSITECVEALRGQMTAFSIPPLST